MATTADCWSAHHNSYLRMTLHFLDPTTRERKQAVLACMRLPGPHTFDVLARAISDIHCRFNIQDKVRRTTTDNASNFVKAFVHYGNVSAELPEEGPVSAEEDDPASLVELLQDPEDAEEDEPEAVEVDEVLHNDGATSFLPAHKRCAAHTFNLIACKDSEEALKDAKFRSVSRRAMGKAQALWNAQNRSTNHADIIKAELKKRLVVPNATRWNSTYDAVSALTSFFTTHRCDI